MKKNSVDFTSYLSPLAWRYGSGEMRSIFSEQHKFELYRKIWVILAQIQQKAGLVSKKELEDLKKHEKNLDIHRILEIEKETKHDVVAAIKEFAEKAKVGGGKIHLGATSMDIVDNADTLRIKEALELVEEKLKQILTQFAQKCEQYASLPCMAYTHLQPAEPTTVGYRFAMYAQDLFIDFETLQYVKKSLKGKGLKGAVGTSASYTHLLHGKKMTAAELEKEVMRKLGIDPVIISTQVSPRKLDFLVLSVLASIAQSLSKFAADLRILQSPLFGEWSEPFGKKQVGSSAMPFKRNPINAEKICSLARYLLQLPAVALENASLSYLERTLDDSANKRVIIPESFLTLDEILETTLKIVPGMVINEKKILQNLETYGPFSASESILMESVKKGADRQKFHEILRDIAMTTWKDIQEGKENQMVKLLRQNKEVKKYLNDEEVKKLLNIKNHVGDAPKRAKVMGYRIRNIGWDNHRVVPRK